MDTKTRGDGEQQKKKLYSPPSPIKAQLLYPNF